MSIARGCIEYRCPELALRGRSRCRDHESQRQARRNAQPERRALYGGSWAAESRAIRAGSDGCVVCRTYEDLTVDHPTRAVFCRPHHGELEARRRADAKVLVC